MKSVTSRIKEILKEPLSVAESMKQMIAFCKESDPDPAWDAFSSIVYKETAGLKQWLANVLTSEPVEDTIAGLWFGIFNPVYEDQTVCDFYIGGSCEFDVKNMDWASDLDYWPRQGYAHSEVLSSIYKIAYGNSLGNRAEHPLCLAYTCFVAKELLSAIELSLLMKEVDEIGVAVGFDDGDYVVLGKMTKNGLKLS